MRTLDEWLALQESVHPQTIDMGLARVTAVARALGVDKPACPVVTVGGTNGKGSTVVHVEGLLRAGGASTGMFTSPHFLRYNERIRIDGVEVADDVLVRAFERIEAARGATTLTFFEYNALAALVIFAERDVDVAVLEVGLGGRLDAVNLVDADVGVVCSIGFDHRDYLGETLDLIGAEKAGIFRSAHPAVLGTDAMPASVYAAIEKLHALPVIVGRDVTWQVDEASGSWSYDGLHLKLRGLPPSALAGSIQYRNASTALAAVEALQGWAGAGAATAGRRPLPVLQLDERTVSEALRGVRLAGRFQVARIDGVEWILDIAHNEPAAAVFARLVRERAMPIAGRGRTWAVIGILGDKDARAIVSSLEPLVDDWVLCALPGPRGTTAEALARRLQLPEGTFTLAASVAAGCDIARRAAGPADRVLVFGSVYAVGPALRHLGIY